MLMTNQQTTELTEPCVGSFHDPSTFVTTQLATVFVAPPLVALSIGHDQFDAAPSKPLTQRVRVVSTVSDYSLRLLSRTAFRTRDADFGERGLRKLNFCWIGTFQPNSQLKTLTVGQYHPLCALAALGFADRSAPFFAGAKLPSRKASSHFRSPSASSAPSSARHAASQTPSSSHCFSRRQQVEGDGNTSGRKRHAAPVCRIHKIPSKQLRFDAQGRPRLSFLRHPSGNNGSINSHCSSVNSFCRFFMTEAHQPTRLMRKCLA